MLPPELVADMIAATVRSWDTTLPEAAAVNASHWADKSKEPPSADRVGAAKRQGPRTRVMLR